jgi:hypothetical protein
MACSSIYLSLCNYTSICPSKELALQNIDSPLLISLSVSFSFRIDRMVERSLV